MTAALYPTVGDAEKPQILKDGETTAGALISGLDKQFAAANKPAQISDEQWNNAKGQVALTAHQTLGWIAMQRQDHLKAEAQFRKVLEMNPKSAQVSYWLGTEVIAQGDPDKNELALFSLARAAAYEGEGALPFDGRQQVYEYLAKVYTNYTGTDEGLSDLMAKAKTQPFPPVDLSIPSKAKAQQEESDLLAAASGEPDKDSTDQASQAVESPLPKPDDSTPTSTSPPERFRYEDFRQVDWGMTPNDVKSSETGKPVVENTNQIGYQVEIAGLKALLAYTFTENQLTSAGYVMLEEHTNRNSYLVDAQNLRGLLEEKYGKPDVSEMKWLNDLYKDKQQEWGMALAVGHLKLNYAWQTPRTTISLDLYGENFKVTHRIRYASRTLGDLERSSQRKKDLDKL